MFKEISVRSLVDQYTNGTEISTGTQDKNTYTTKLAKESN